MSNTTALLVGISTYQRGKVFLNTISYLQNLDQCPAEIIVVDQTLKHERKIEQQLGWLHNNSIVRWTRLQSPSIPHAMNVEICEASCSIVLFFDDDIVAMPGLSGR